MLRVVITGWALSLPKWGQRADFEMAIRRGRSGIRLQPRMQEMGMQCHEAGEPQVDANRISETFSAARLRALNSGMLYARLAAIECWRDAGLIKDVIN